MSNKISDILDELELSLNLNLSDKQLKHAVGCVISKHIIGSQMDRSYTTDAGDFLNQQVGL